MARKSVFREFPSDTEEILRKIKEKGEVCGMYALAKELRMDKSDCCKYVRFLNDAGLLSITRDNDKRYNVVRLTKNGNELLNIVDSIVRIVEEEGGNV